VEIDATDIEPVATKEAFSVFPTRQVAEA
jgi:hypothetical protein